MTTQQDLLNKLKLYYEKENDKQNNAVNKCARCDTTLKDHETVCPVCRIRAGTDGSLPEHYV